VDDAAVDSTSEDSLTPELIAALGRILGEALAAQYQQDTGAMINPRAGVDHVTGEDW
jgi:hypothetical protein